VLLPTCNAAVEPRASSYFAGAVPILPGVTGTRFLATDTPGTIFVDTDPVPNLIPAGIRTLQQ
jgi:hypothetical protein